MVNTRTEKRKKEDRPPHPKSRMTAAEFYKLIHEDHLLSFAAEATATDFWGCTRCDTQNPGEYRHCQNCGRCRSC